MQSEQDCLEINTLLIDVHAKEIAPQVHGEQHWDERFGGKETKQCHHRADDDGQLGPVIR
jgi:hypothetical protein